MKKPDVNPPLTSEQATAVDAICEGDNVIVLGPEGSGRSLVLMTSKALVEGMGKRAVACSTTGVGANYVKGITINQALGLPPSLEKDGALALMPEGQLATTDVLFINDISTCHGLFIDYLYEGVKAEEEKGHHIQVVLLGDFYSLGAIMPRNLALLSVSLGYSRPPYYAFQSMKWDYFHFVKMELTKTFLQKNEKTRNALALLRKGDSTGLRVLLSQSSPVPIEGAPWICLKKSEVERINDETVESLPGAVVILRDSSMCTFPDSLLPVPKSIKVKEGIPVMMAINDPKGRFENGTLAKIRKIQDDKVYLVIQGKKGHICVSRFHWPIYSQSGKKLGTYVQFPFQPAFARTAWKILHDRFESANILVHPWQPGQLYAILGRMTDMSKVHVEGITIRYQVTVSGDVKNWFNENMEEEGFDWDLLDRSVQTVDIPLLPYGEYRNGFRYGTHVHKFIENGQLIERTLIVKKNAHQDICGVTNFSYLYRSESGCDSNTSDWGKSAYFVTSFLNYVFVDVLCLDSFSELTLDHVRSFFYAYSRGAYGNEGTRRTMETVQKCVIVVAMFLRGVCANYPTLFEIRPEMLTSGRALFLQLKKEYGLTFDYDAGTINRDMPEAAVLILLSQIYVHHPRILLNVALGLCAGLRPSETCSLDASMIDISRDRFGKMTSVKIDLSREVLLRSDGVRTGKIKKHRDGRVHPLFLTLFERLYERYEEWFSTQENKDPVFSPICLDKRGLAMTYKAYYQEFREAVEEIIPILANDPDPKVRDTAVTLRREGIAPHFWRHQFTLILCVCGCSVIEIKDSRGDDDANSAALYLERKGAVRTLYTGNVDKYAEHILHVRLEGGGEV